MSELFQFDVHEDHAAAAQASLSRQACGHQTRQGPSALDELANCNAPPGSLLWQLSRPSQMSLVAKYMALDDAARDAFEERAAILEHDAGLPRPEAEAEAFRMVMQVYRDPG